MKQLTSYLIKAIFSLAIIFPHTVFADKVTIDTSAETNEILVTINNERTVTDKDLEEALRSSPFYTQFNTMGEKQQASLRGNILKRLVIARLLSLEAEKEKLQESAEFIKEVDSFRKGLLYRYYMSNLKDKIKIPKEKQAQMKQQFKGNRDAYTAAKATFITKQYNDLYQLTIKSLQQRYHVKLHNDQISANAKPETIILEGDKGIVITMADIYTADKNTIQKPHKDELLDKTIQLAELLLVAKIADEEGIDVSAQVDGFKQERLPAMYLEQKQKKWTGSPKVLRDYYVKHPEASFIPQRWHLGMIVLKTEDEAKAVLARIKKGESLFKLAGELSIDPYGREHKGDMGWVREQSGDPIIEDAIKNLPDGQISGVINTHKGYLIATILDRRPGGKRKFISMQDKIAQLVINEKMHNFLQDLQSKYDVQWSVLKKQNETQESAQNKTQKKTIKS